MGRNRRHATFSVITAVAFGALAACSDSDDELAPRHHSNSPTNGADGSEDPALSAPPNPGQSPLRRLTNDEYNATVADLLGDTTAPATAFPGATTSTQGYDTYASGLGVSATHAEAFLTAAETLAKNAIVNLPKLLGCDVAAKGERACVEQFVASFGERAFRRPLSQAESARFAKLAQDVRAAKPLADAIRVAVEAFLLSPAFLYRVEVGLPAAPGAFAHLNSWEMASRISYLFTGSMPDDELFRAARADELTKPENIEKQARRLITSPRSKDTFRRFVDQWLELRAIASMQKSAQSFAGWSDNLRPLMKEEANRVVDSVVWEADGDARKLFSVDYTFVNGPLASFYGIGSVSGDAFVRVPVDPAQRRGIVTLPGILASHGKPNETLPARRGKFVRTKIFCSPIGDPPPNAAAQAPPRAPGATVREWFTQIQQEPACGGCHKTIDGLGFGFENYDSVGHYRTTDLGKSVDASGALSGTDVDGAFVGAIELSHKLEASKQAALCVARQAFRFASGRPDAPEDAHSLAVLGAEFTKANFDIRELLVALTKTDAFTLKPVPGGSQ
jgi:hypothetical protein